MTIHQSLTAQITNKFTLSFAFSHSLTILQLSQQELIGVLFEEIEKNPLLELTSFSMASYKASSDFEIVSKESLFEILNRQIRDTFSSMEQRKIAYHLLTYLDERGFFIGDLEAIAKLYPIKIENLNLILSNLQTFDPPGIFAKNLQEMWLIQLKRLNLQGTLVYQIIQDHFDDFIHHRLYHVQKKFKLSESEFSAILKTLSKLAIHPASGHQSEPPLNPIVDLHFIRLENNWTVDLDTTYLPTFQIQSKYLRLKNLDLEEKKTMQFFKTSAMWLIHSLQKRKKTLYQIGNFLLQKQRSYFNEEGPLIPITQSEIAQELNLSESTVSRGIGDKYFSGPFGIQPLKMLVSNPNHHAKETLKMLILNEDKKSPFTDQILVEKLQKAGYQIARRTIAKYRTELKIQPAHLRKHLG